MAIKFKVLGFGQVGTGQAAIYGPVPAGKAAIVKSMRFVNVAAGTLSINVYIKRTGGTARRVLPVGTSLAAGFMYPHSSEITLEAMDSIEAYASNSLSIDYVLSGVEKDV